MPSARAPVSWKRLWDYTVSLCHAIFGRVIEVHRLWPFFCRSFLRCASRFADGVRAFVVPQADPKMPKSRKLLAVPFVGKDVPSRASEFSHPDVVVGESNRRIEPCSRSLLMPATNNGPSLPAVGVVSITRHSEHTANRRDCCRRGRAHHPGLPLRGLAYVGLQGQPSGPQGRDGRRAERPLPPTPRVPDVGAVGHAGRRHRERCQARGWRER